jgi:hypothetical protein
MFDILVFQNEDGSLNLTNNLTSDNNKKILSILLYFLSINLGEDKIYPDLGIPYNQLFANPSITNIILNNFIEIFNKKFGTNISFISSKFSEESGTLEVVINLGRSVVELKLKKDFQVVR